MFKSSGLGHDPGLARDIPRVVNTLPRIYKPTTAIDRDWNDLDLDFTNAGIIEL